MEHPPRRLADARIGRRAKVLAVAAVALASVGKPGVAHTRPFPSRYPTTKPPLTHICSCIARRFGAVTQETPGATVALSERIRGRALHPRSPPPQMDPRALHARSLTSADQQAAATTGGLGGGRVLDLVYYWGEISASSERRARGRESRGERAIPASLSPCCRPRATASCGRARCGCDASTALSARRTRSCRPGAWPSSHAEAASRGGLRRAASIGRLPICVVSSAGQSFSPPASSAGSLSSPASPALSPCSSLLSPWSSLLSPWSSGVSAGSLSLALSAGSLWSSPSSLC